MEQAGTVPDLLCNACKVPVSIYGGLSNLPTNHDQVAVVVVSPLTLLPT